MADRRPLDSVGSLQLFPAGPAPSGGVGRARVQCRLLGCPVCHAPLRQHDRCVHQRDVLSAGADGPFADRFKPAGTVASGHHRLPKNERETARGFQSLPFFLMREREFAAIVNCRKNVHDPITELKMKMRRYAVALLLLIAFAAAAAQDERKKSDNISLDRIVAVVNSEVVTRLDLDEQVKVALQQLNRQGTPLPARDVLERQLLERLVTAKILAQNAKETGLRVDDTQLQRSIERIAQENKMSPEAFRKMLETDGIDFNRFREELRNEILIARL